MDRIVCVSESVMKSFAKCFPSLEGKMEYCYNFLSFDQILEKSNLPSEIEIPSDRCVLFSASRLAPEKAIPRAIYAIQEVFSSYPELVWYLAGNGPERQKIEEAIAACGLENRIVLLGGLLNPYPMMKRADLVVNVSYHEAAPMVFFESLALGTPVFATRTLSAEEMLSDGENAFLCENSAEGIRNALFSLMEHKENLKKAKAKLESYSANNEKSLQKIKEFLEL
jgi:glycosyltransferase involved in cell wall biosynthesis